MTVLMIALGAAVGAPSRYLLDRAVQRRHSTPMPWGTLTVNLVACALLGALVGRGANLSGAVYALLGTGLCGALSTYSTFAFETARLTELGHRRIAVTNVVISVVAGVGLAAGSYWLAH